MNLTSKGYRLLTTAAVLAVLALMFGDEPLGAASGLAALLLILDCCALLRRVGHVRRAEVSPSKLELRLIAGSEEHVTIAIKSRYPVRLRSEQAWVRVEEQGISGGTIKAKLVLTPLTKGLYKLSFLEAEVSSPLGLAKGRVRVPVAVNVKVRPRILPALAEALRLLLLAEGWGFGERSSSVKGLGLEYYASREYLLGDELRLMDWKATARLQKLYVKEFHAEVSGASYVIYETRSHGAYTADEQAAMLLHVLLAAARSGLSVTFTVVSGDKVLFHGTELSGVDALKVAAAYVMESQEVNEWEVYELVMPKPSKALINALRRVRAEGLARVFEARVHALANDVIRITLQSLPRGSAVSYVGPVLVDARRLVDLAYEAANNGKVFQVVTPGKPWIDARDLEEAYLMYVSFGRIIEALRHAGAEVRPGLRSLLGEGVGCGTYS